MDLIKSANSVRTMDADVLKAISIVAVVFIHSALVIPASVAFVSWIFLSLRFCVPIFVFLWAYFTEKSILKSPNKWPYLIKKFRGLLIPFLFWSLIYFFIIADFNKLTLIKTLTTHWVGSGWAGQYYFIILFQLIFIFIVAHSIGQYLYEKSIVIILISIIFYAIVSYSNLFNIEIIYKINDRPFIYWVPYVLLGIVYAKDGIKKKLSVPIYFMAIAPLLIPIEVFLFHPEIISHTPYLLPSTFIASIIMVNSILGKEIKFLKVNKPTFNLVSLLSRNTLGIFCLNPLVVITLSYLLHYVKYKFDFVGHYFATPVISTVFVIGICIMLINALKRVGLSILITN